ncbi:PQQ-binding-like beta-propeller repeat protein [Streptomyces sp. NBC_00519]|uniref:outer membrane protein assembly factor BamB family protein n=1 Tax=Streptomyces sp. NBC_00519 TaxID=2975764 RepID=UPI00386E9928
MAAITEVEDTGKNNKNYVYAFNGRGQQRWRTDLPSGGMTRIAASSKGFYCTAGGQLHRLNAEGKIQWSRKLPGSVDARGWYLAVGPDDTVYTDVSYGDYLFTSGDLFAYRADGTLKWKIGQGAVDSIPLVKDKTLYVGSYDNHLYAIDTTSGGIRWSTSLSGDVADPAMIESTLAVSVSNSDALYGVTRAGKKSWTAAGRTVGQYGRTAAFGHLFVTATGKIFATRTDGTSAWEVTRPAGKLNADPWLSDPAVNGTTLICCSDNSHVLGIDTTGKIVWTIDTKEKAGSLSGYAPLIVGSRIHVAGDAHILAFDMPHT